MRKSCPSPYKNWLKNQNEDKPIHPSVHPNQLFSNVAKRQNHEHIDSKFVMIQLPTNVFIYEWFTIKTTFANLKEFASYMNYSGMHPNENYYFVDGFDENIRYNDSDLITTVFEKSKQSIIQNANNSNLHQIQNTKIFLKIKY